MAGEVNDDNLHLLGNYFLVDLGSNINIPFKEAINLPGNDSVLEYRNANGPMSGLIQMPGMRQERVILSNGVFSNNKSFFDWYDKCKTNSAKRQSVVIKLIDESGLPIMIWKLTDAYAVEISPPDLMSNGNDISIERISVSFSKMTVSYGG
jgi:phage tail-like protein